MVDLLNIVPPKTVLVLQVPVVALLIFLSRCVRCSCGVIFQISCHTHGYYLITLRENVKICSEKLKITPKYPNIKILSKLHSHVLFGKNRTNTGTWISIGILGVKILNLSKNLKITSKMIKGEGAGQCQKYGKISTKHW